MRPQPDTQSHVAARRWNELLQPGQVMQCFKKKKDNLVVCMLNAEPVGEHSDLLCELYAVRPAQTDRHSTISPSLALLENRILLLDVCKELLTGC
jgi:hypothetical protein